MNTRLLIEIHKMLKWIIIKSEMEERGQKAGMNYSPEAMGKQIDKLAGQLPDIDYILEEPK